MASTYDYHRDRMLIRPWRVTSPIEPQNLCEEHLKTIVSNPTLDSVIEPTCVGWNSPISQRRAVYVCALMFKREFRYDFTQYGEDGFEDDERARAFLWAEDGLGVGACCFRWREWTNRSHGWGLQWAWMHPFCRREGRLTRIWPYFIARFGHDFEIESPISIAMASFVCKHGTGPQRAAWSDSIKEAFPASQ